MGQVRVKIVQNEKSEECSVDCRDPVCRRRFRFLETRHKVSPIGYPGEKIYVPWVPRIAHRSLTPGHPAGRLPPHRGSPDKKIYVYVPSSFLITYGEPARTNNSTASSRTFTPSVRRKSGFITKDFLLPPRMRWKSSDVGSGGRNGILRLAGPEASRLSNENLQSQRKSTCGCPP